MSCRSVERAFCTRISELFLLLVLVAGCAVIPTNREDEPQVPCIDECNRVHELCLDRCDELKRQARVQNPQRGDVSVAAPGDPEQRPCGLVCMRDHELCVAHCTEFP